MPKNVILILIFLIFVMTFSIGPFVLQMYVNNYKKCKRDIRNTDLKQKQKNYLR